MLANKSLIALNSKTFLLNNLHNNEKIIIRMLSSKRYISNAVNGAIDANSLKTHESEQAADPNNQKLDLKFENSEVAFKSKSTLQLLRGLLVFQLCGIRTLVDNQNTVMSLSRKLLGKKLFSAIMKATIYGHFVAGEDQVSIKPTIENMAKYGVKPILDYSVEDDLNSEVSHQNKNNELQSKYFHPSEVNFDKNMQVFVQCIEAAAKTSQSDGIAAIKVTSLLRPKLLLKLSQVIKDAKNSNNAENKRLIELENILNSKDLNSDLVKLMPKESFSANEAGEIRNMAIRLQKIMQHAQANNVRVFVDAEQTYFQDAIRHFTMELMKTFNVNGCVVMNTYQCYLKAANKELTEDLAMASKGNFIFGAKLVRGAYMEQERPRAKEMGYEDPINPDFDATTKMYEKNLIACLNEIKKRPNKVEVMVASHNEETVRFAVEKMNEMGIKASDKAVYFGQLLGMCDYISFSLGAAGYPVYKYTPYGPVEEVLPYLSRRAIENRGIFDKVKKEKRLLYAEIMRRMTGSRMALQN